MKVVVVGGHTRNIGKTSVMAGLIRGLPSKAWTAVKITQYGHGICSHDGEPCECAPDEHPFALSEEKNARGRGDTCRFLAAGARRSLWLRVREGQLSTALPLLFEALAGDEHVIVESNSILEFLKPAVYVVVLDSSNRDFKSSARQFLAQADALVPIESTPDAGAWQEIQPHSLEGKPTFPVSRRDYANSDLCRFVREKLERPEAELQLPNFSNQFPAKERPWRH